MSQSVAKITIRGLQLLLNSDLRAMAVKDSRNGLRLDHFC